jgi:hypothetical protein
VARLKDLLLPLFSDIWIIVYLRRQDDFLLSTYSTSVKSGSTEPLRLPVPRRADARYNHWTLLSRWADVFGKDRIICRRFEKDTLQSGDVVEDFLEAAALNPALPFRKPAPANQSLDATSLEFLRMFNKHIPSSSADARGRLLQVLAARPSDGTLVTLEPQELADFMAQFHQSNGQVANAYFGGMRTDSDDPLFAPRSDLRPRERPGPLTAEQAVEIASWLWRRRNPPTKQQAARSKRKDSKGRRQKDANAAAQPVA